MSVATQARPGNRAKKRARLRGQIKVKPDRAVDAKELYRQLLIYSDSTRPNWSRVVLHQIDSLSNSDPEQHLYSHVAPSPVRSDYFLLHARRLDQCGQTDAALDLLYEAIDERLRHGRFTDLDELLAKVSVETLSIDMILGLLTATLPATSQLPARNRLRVEAETVLRNRGEYEDGLLAGL